MTLLLYSTWEGMVYVVACDITITKYIAWHEVGGCMSHYYYQYIGLLDVCGCMRLYYYTSILYKVALFRWLYVNLQ